MANKLTDKQKMFCREYLIDLNATQASIRAGYSKKTAQQIGTENLAKPVIQAQLAKMMDKRAAKVEISAEYVLQTILDTVELSKADNDKQNIYKGAELLGKHLKLFTDKQELQNLGADGQPIDPPTLEVSFVTTDKDTDT
jgi:phage terminase small subunit